MSRNECYSLVAEPLAASLPPPPLDPRSPNHCNPHQSSYDSNKTDEVMENLQKLFDTHQRKKEWNQQPQHQIAGCSSSSNNNFCIDNNAPSTSNNNHNNSANNSHMPLFLLSDDRSAILKSTIVSDQLLACFVIGGECRLCFPQMRALCLGDIATYKIDETLKSLAIINPLASEEQLIMLKRSQIVPIYLPKCELITKTNAERLIAVLKSTGLPRPIEIQNEGIRSRLHSLNVVHDCFGGCSALLYPSMVPNPCLECRTCHYMFKPEDFCRHTHKPATGKNMCFWGFDASNWPYYIRIDDEETSVIASSNHTSNEGAESELANFIQNYSQQQQQTLFS